MNNKYLNELQILKDWDEVQTIKLDSATGYNFITTSGHGYLVVPNNDKNYRLCKQLQLGSFEGRLALYLEEDNEYSDFKKALGVK